MDYTEACAFLSSYVDFEVQTPDVYAPERFSLARVQRLLSCLGDPHERYPSIHIAGTKGKGSVAAMVESILHCAGHRTGLYTSPHLCDLRERFQVGRSEISPVDFTTVINTLRPHIEEIGEITFFEIATALALEWFARRQVTVAVLEVGLGGRLDATNVVNPSVCAITPISFDHINLLGNTLEEIAAEKGGIVKSGVPVVCAPQQPAALAVLEETCDRHGAPFRLVGRDWRVVRHPVRPPNETFAMWTSTEPHSWKEFSLPLLGAHQVENAAVAVAVIEELQKQGWFVVEEAITRGLLQVKWPARCQLIPGDPSVVVDCAHNAASAACLAKTIREVFPGQSPVLVFGSMRDKDVAGVLAKLLPIARHTIMTRADHPRASTPASLASSASGAGCPVSVADNLPEALDKALMAAGGSGLVLVTGSVSLAGEALRSAQIRWPHILSLGARQP